MQAINLLQGGGRTDDVLLCVLQFVSLSELACCSACSKHLYQVSNANAVWLWRCQQIWDEDAQGSMPSQLKKLLETEPKQGERDLVASHSFLAHWVPLQTSFYFIVQSAQREEQRSAGQRH